MRCPTCKQVVDDRYKAHSRLPADKVWIHSGNHKKLVKARELIEKAKALENEVYEEQIEHRKTLKAKYDYSVHVKTQKESHWHSDIPEGYEYIVITATLTNEEIYKDHMNRYGSISNPPESSKSSVKYYRMHGLLFYESGGWIMLKDKVPCSEEQWKDLKNGKLDEFLK
jgi:hypothetical protein